MYVSNTTVIDLKLYREANCSNIGTDTLIMIYLQLIFTDIDIGLGNHTK